MRRVLDRFLAETGAWLGVRENLGLRVVSCVKPEMLEVRLGTLADVSHIMPSDISNKLLGAIRGHRSISAMFIQDPHASEGVVYVIAIDMDRMRVDRTLSSPELLLDPWLKKQYSTYHGYLSPSDYMHHVNWFDLLDAPFTPFGGRPFRDRYERTFLQRQEKITALFGHSRRFESLISCLAPQLDPVDRIQFKSAMRNLWEHECWTRRRVSLAEAEQALSAARLDVTLVEVEREDVMGDPETLIQECAWTDVCQNMIAHGEVVRDGWSKNGDQLVGLYVFGEYFCLEDGERLLKCFRERTEKDLRKAPDAVSTQATQPS